MKYLFAILLIVGLAVLCAAGLAAGSWLYNTTRASTSLALPATVDAGLLPTPTAVATVVATLPPASTEVPPLIDSTLISGGPFTGTFAGTMSGSEGSRADVNLVLIQNGDTVSGTIQIGQGLVIDGGNCGRQAVPAGMQSASGRTDPTNPNHLDTVAVVEVQGMAITIRLSANLSPDGQSLTSQASIDLPFLCGSDPILTGSFTRQP
ncbi:MAG: hypothetical protein R6X18_11410 [Chloroflexota bacterium]|jgi:hypothetical protein